MKQRKVNYTVAQKKKSFKEIFFLSTNGVHISAAFNKELLVTDDPAKSIAERLNVSASRR